MRVRRRIIAGPVGLVMVLFLLSGCVGFYGNTKRFLQPPTEGMLEIEMIKTYGEPSFSSVVEDQTVYTYRVREVQYIIAAGLYNGYDLIVICRDGRVVEVKKLPRPVSFTVLHPVPWVVPQ